MAALQVVRDLWQLPRLIRCPLVLHRRSHDCRLLDRPPGPLPHQRPVHCQEGGVVLLYLWHQLARVRCILDVSGFYTSGWYCERERQQRAKRTVALPSMHLALSNRWCLPPTCPSA